MRCSTGSSPRLRSRSSDTSSAGWIAARSRPTLASIVTLCAVPALASATGCGQRTILVPEGAPIRLGADVRGRVYTLDRETKEWRLSLNAQALPEGWYLVPPSFVEEAADAD